VVAVGMPRFGPPPHRFSPKVSGTSLPKGVWHLGLGRFKKSGKVTQTSLVYVILVVTFAACKTVIASFKDCVNF